MLPDYITKNSMNSPVSDAAGAPIPDTPINWSARTPGATQVDTNGKVIRNVFFIEAWAANGVNNIFLVRNKKF